ncbi:hypothetical protein ABZ688_22770, partial [Streptomyces fimicarius]
MSLPGADELFRTTGGGMGLQSSSPAERRRKANGEPRVPAPAGESDPSGPTPPADHEEHAAAASLPAGGTTALTPDSPTTRVRVVTFTDPVL